MHIEKRALNQNLKYYLSHSYREGNKIHKFRKYLGLNLNPKLLEERRKIAEKLILDEITKYNLITDPLYGELTEKERDFVKKLQVKIPLKIFHLSEEQWDIFSKLFTYHTNAIEGSRLNSKEVNELLDQDRWPDKSKEDIAEAYGVNEAILFIRNTKEHLSVELLQNIHRLVFKNSKPFAGKFRKPGEEVVVMDSFGTVVHEGAPQSRVVYLLRKLVRWYTQHQKTYPGLLLAAVVHNQFENIHPFRDGNGRVGRIILNNILIKHNLPPLNIDFKNRLEYYAALQAYERNHDLKPTIDLFLKEYASLSKVLGDYQEKRV